MRNKHLAIAFALLALDALLATIFLCTLPSDSRLDTENMGRKQLRTIYLQASTSPLLPSCSSHLRVAVPTSGIRVADRRGALRVPGGARAT